MNVDLNSIQDIPDSLLDKLASHNDLFLQNNFSDSLSEHWKLAPLVSELNEYCLTNNVIGIHFTRSVKSSILSKGLLSQSGSEFRYNFLESYSHLFTTEELLEIKRRWLSYFGTTGCEERDFRIFFNFTDDALRNGGADELLGMFGGEQITMCFDNDGDCSISEKLSLIGEPLIVRCSIDPHRVETYIEQPWGKILMSAYHKHINPGAYRIDQDGSVTYPISKRDIVEIITLTNCLRGIRNA